MDPHTRGWPRQAALSILALLTAGLAAEPAPLRVLLLSGQNNHDWKQTTPVLQRALLSSGRFAVEVNEQPAALPATAFAQYQVVVSNWNTFNDKEAKPWDPAVRQAFLDWIHGGGGFVVVHAGGSMFYDWPAYHQLVGGTWGAGTGHGPVHTFQVRMVEPTHPITQGLGDFRTTDELWHRMAAQPGRTILATALSAADRGGSGADEPVAFVVAADRGRCLNLVLGHDVAAMQSTGFRALLCRGTEWAATGTVTLPVPAGDLSAPAAPGEAELAEALKALATYRVGQPRDAVMVVEQAVQATAASAPARIALAARLAVLLGTNLTADAKQVLCRQLSLIGSDAEVTALVPLLADPVVGTVAREALERMPGEAAGQALRTALGTTTGRLRAGVVQSVGTRRDAAAVGLLAPLMSDADRDTATAAVDALGRIGTGEALAALATARPGLPAELQPVLAQALLAAAESGLAGGAKPQAQAALRTLCAADQPRRLRLAAFPLYVASLSPAATATALTEALASADEVQREAGVRAACTATTEPTVSLVAGKMPALSPTAQVQILSAWAEHAVTVALPTVTTAAASSQADVRLAALATLGYVGNAATVPVLTAALAKAGEPEKRAAREALGRLHGTGVDDAILTALRGDAPALRRSLMPVLVTRGTTAAVPDLLKEAAAGDADNRAEALRAVGRLAGNGACPHLITMLDQAADADRPEVQGALVAVCSRSGGPGPVLAALPKASAAQKKALAAVLANLGGAEALQAVRDLATSADAEVRAAAQRALTDWSTPAALPDLDALVSAPQADPALRILALRGIARLAPLAGDLPADGLAALLTKAMAAAQRAEERKALLAALGTVRSRIALTTAAAQLGDAALKEEAGTAVLQIAEAVWPTCRDESLTAADQVVKAVAGEELRQRARNLALLVRQNRNNLAVGATATSPDELEPDGQGREAPAAVDGDPATYWDEKDGEKLYRLRIDLREPATVASIRITGYQQHAYAPRDFDILCDDRVASEVRNAVYANNQLAVEFPPTACKSLELRITGYYGQSPAVRELGIFGPGGEESARTTPPAQSPELAWERTETALALLNRGQVVWKLNVDPREGKPYVHPLALLDGTVLTDLRPTDHVWHRAFWWSWKFINGLNYWEEDPRTLQSEGQTELLRATLEPGQGGVAKAEMDLSYHPPGQPALMTEKRTLEFAAPQTDGSYRIDWTSTFTAAAAGDVTLDRTPPPGQPNGVGHGGYAGLSVRLNPATRGWSFTGSEHASGREAHGQPARWLDLSGPLAVGSAAGVAVFDHPRNLRHPSPWFVEQGMPYFGPALLFNEPYVLKAGTSLTLRYRLLVHPGVADQARLDEEWRTFAR